MENSLVKVFESERETDFLNYLIEGNAKPEAVTKAVWDFVFDYPKHNLFLSFGWNGGTVHAIIAEVLERQKNKVTL